MENIKDKIHVLIYLPFLVLICSCSPKEYADIVFVNGKIVTVDSSFTIKEAIAIKDNLILEVGSTEKIATFIGTNTKKIDLKGKTILPGFNEGHVHPVTASQANYAYGFSDIKTLSDLFDWISKKANEKVDGEWIVHPKLFATRLKEFRFPTLRELDSLAPNNPIFLNAAYGGILNSNAMRVSGIDGKTKHKGVLLNEVDGTPTGFIRRSAFELLPPQSVQINMTEKEKLQALESLIVQYNKVGITSICSGSGGPDQLQLFRKLRDSNRLTVRLFQNLSAPFNPHDSEEDIRKSLLNFNYVTGDGDDWTKVGAIKVIIDGGILTGTAYLLEPYGKGASQVFGITDPKYRGVLLLSKDELSKVIKVTSELGWKFTAHVTGGGGVDELLRALEEVNETIPINNLRHSIIHGNFFNTEAITKMSELGIYGDVQPAWYYKDADMLDKVLGKKRVANFQPYKSMLEANIVLNGGSDHMYGSDSFTSINPYNPFLTISILVDRKTENGNIYNAEESISRKQAIRMLTINNAMASFEEDQKGSLEKGKLADLIVISEDILTCDSERIKDINVELTMLDGTIIYSAN